MDMLLLLPAVNYSSCLPFPVVAVRRIEDYVVQIALEVCTKVCDVV